MLYHLKLNYSLIKWNWMALLKKLRSLLHESLKYDSDWLKKMDRLRLCLDPWNLNEIITKQEH